MSTNTNFDPSNEIGYVLSAFASGFLKNIEIEDLGLDSPWSDIRNPDVAEGNSILDSEILLTFLLPEQGLETFRYDQSPKVPIGQHGLYKYFETAAGGNFSFWNEKIYTAFLNYFKRNQDSDGEPLFSSNSYLTEKTDGFLEGKKIETVDGYSFSLSASLRIKIIAARLIKHFEGDEEQEKWINVSHLASKRITGALQGLTESFCVAAFPKDKWRDGIEDGAISGTGWDWPETPELEQIEDEIKSLGFSFANGKAFEIGWSWGPVDRSKFVKIKKMAGQFHGLSESYRSKDVDLLAEPAPYLYFTINALDGISDLALPEVESGGLLDREQLELASTLKSLANLTSKYWMILGKTPTPTGEVHPGEWMIETMPWKTSDGQASLYWNLYLSRLILSSRTLTATQYERFLSLAVRMAEAARISTPPFPLQTDPVVPSIHAPGLQMSLMAKGRDKDSKNEKAFDFTAADFAPQLLKMVAQISAEVSDASVKARSHALMNTIWEHLLSRTCKVSGRAWDSFWNAWNGKHSFFPTDEKKIAAREQYGYNHPRESEKVNSWYMTQRVVEALVVSASAWRKRPSPSVELRTIAQAMVQEIQWSLTMSKTEDSFIQSKRTKLERCRTMIVDQPGRALSMLIELQNEINERGGL